MILTIIISALISAGIAFGVSLLTHRFLSDLLMSNFEETFSKQAKEIEEILNKYL